MLILKRHKQRKLRILVANDNIFQCLIIKNSLEILTYVERIDTAHNGQEALDLVMKNEIKYSQGESRYYDLVFLDLGMPIKDGYQACKLIVQHYKQIMLSRNSQPEKTAPSSDWQKDLSTVFNHYQSKIIDSGDINSMSIDSKKLMDIFKRLYKKVSFNVLNNMDKPFVLAYSAFVNQEIIEKTKESGFDGCLEEKLSPKELQEVIKGHVDAFILQELTSTVNT